MRILTVFIFIICNSASFAMDEKLVLKNIKKMGKELKRELKVGMKESPKDALKICNIKAPIIEAKYKEDNLKIGRVSLKNRNPNNRPKEWMLKYIDGFHKKSIKEKYISIQISEKRRGLLMPIITMPLCLKCHGDNIDGGLHKEILKKYPNDKAIGYKSGDIRGFFWAEYNK